MAQQTAWYELSKRMIKSTCTEKNCIDEILARGLCSRHYQRARKNGTLDKDSITRLCACVCGELTEATFKHGHNRRGLSTDAEVRCPCGSIVKRKKSLVESGRAKYCSIKCRQTYSPKTAEDHPTWKGDDVGMGALHDWVKKYKTLPGSCEWCRSVEPLDWANLSQTYLRDLDDWAALCRRCHSKYDRICRYDSQPYCSNGHIWTKESTYYYKGNRRCRICIADRGRVYRNKNRGKRARRVK